MSETWQESMKWSASIAMKSLPIIQDMLQDKSLQLIQVEKKDDEVCQLLDKHCGIDYFLLKNNEHAYGLAWRAQRVIPGKEFNSFTIRKARKSGAKTELAKRQEAIHQKSVYPFYVAHAFVNKYNDEIISMAITTTEDEIAFFENPLSKVYLKNTGPDQIGQSKFHALYWVDMRLLGYNVIVYKNGVGIS